jgi:hypothetical protein
MPHKFFKPGYSLQINDIAQVAPTKLKSVVTHDKGDWTKENKGFIFFSKVSFFCWTLLLVPLFIKKTGSDFMADAPDLFRYSLLSIAQVVDSKSSCY